MDRAAFWLYRLVAGTLCLLPLKLVFRLGWLLGRLAYWLAVPYRRLVLQNLQIAFGKEKSSAELRALARKHFATLGANLFASIKLPRLSREKIESVVRVEGLQYMDRDADERGGFIHVISHLGNWEMFAQISPIFFKCKVGTIYQALGNPHIDAGIQSERARLGLALFERKEGFVAATKFIRAGGAVGVLVDQHAGDAGLWCPFFGRLASTSTLAATLGLRAGARLLPAAVYTDGVARWRCVIRPPVTSLGQSVETITQQINEILEEQIREQPEDWFWVHNRWKLPRPKFLLATYKRGVAISTNPGTGRGLQPFRILIRSPNWLGDAVMSIPAVRAIKRGRPDAHVTVLTPTKLADLWSDVPEADEVICIEPGESVFTVARKIRRDFEAAVIFPNSLRTALEAWLARIPRRVGFPGHRRSWLLNQILRDKPRKKSARSQPPRHQIHHYLELAKFIGADPDACLEPDPRPARPVSRLPLLGLCPGAEYGPAKRWFPENFAAVIRQVATTCDCEWVVLGTEKDAGIADEILHEFHGQHRNMIGRTTLGQLIAELRGCDLLLTNDTGTMHLAASVGTPTVSIFGSTEPALTGPLGDGHRVLRHHVPCSPCFLRKCPLDLRCMKSISVDEVVRTIFQMLDRAARRHSTLQPDA
jgi:lipopolysaccharide heptosyltransferase II